MLTTQTYSQYDFTQAYQIQNKRFYKNHGKSCEEDTSFLIKLAPVEHQNIQSDHHHYLYFGSTAEQWNQFGAERRSNPRWPNFRGCDVA